MVVWRLLVLCLVPAICDFQDHHGEVREWLVPSQELPLKTRGRYVVGKSGRRVLLACVNWYGASQRQMVMNGLDNQPASVMASRIVELKFNCIRLPFSLEMVLDNMSVPRPEEMLAANPELLGLSPMEVFDKTVTALTNVGLLVILNNHVSSAVWCCSGNDGEGLWHTERYPEQEWLRGLRLVARRYSKNPRVVGFDLRNEIRANGAILPTWGSGDVFTDWSIAAIKGAKEVLKEQQDLLIVVSGIHFGMRLSEVPNRPIHEEVPELHNRTVYTTHFYYGWSFDMMAYDRISKNIIILMFFACWLWVLLALDRESKNFRSFQAAPSSQEANFPWELRAAAAVLALQALLFAIGEYLGQSCGHVHIVSPPAFVVLSSWCFCISYVIWTRILVAYTLVLFTNFRNKDVQWRYSRPRDLPDDTLQMPVPALTIPRFTLAMCASESLVQPLRERKRFYATAALLLLLLLVVVGQKCGSYNNFRGELDACLGPLLSGEGVTPAPVWLSEFGTDVRDNYFNNIMRYIKENELDFAYWSINGEKRLNESETYGLLQDDNFAVRLDSLLEDK